MIKTPLINKRHIARSALFHPLSQNTIPIVTIGFSIFKNAKSKRAK